MAAVHQVSHDIKAHRNPMPLHAESSGFESASPDQVFAYLDDHKRLALHMSQPSWRMDWSSMGTNFDAIGGYYADWCTQRMVDDAVKQFGSNAKLGGKP